MSLFLSRKLFPLFVTQFLGAFNDNVFKNALVIWITYHLAGLTDYSPSTLVTLAAGIFILPFFLLSATAGELGDRYDKSQFIRYIKLCEILIMGFAGIGFYLGNIWILLTVLFFMGAQSAFFGPVKYSILPDLLNEKELIGGNALVEAGTFVAILLGTILGGLLILSPYGAILISSLVVVLAILGWGASNYILKVPAASPNTVISPNIISQTFKTLSYSTYRSDIFATIIGISWFWLLGATYLAQFPTFAKEILNANEEVVTFFLTLFSLGIAFGSLYCKTLLKGGLKITYVPLGAIGMLLFSVILYGCCEFIEPTGPHTLMGFQTFIQDPIHFTISFSLLAIAFCGGIFTVPLYTLLQVRVEKSHRSRVIAANNVMNALFMVASALLTLILLHFSYKITDVFFIVGILNFPIALLIKKYV